MSTINWLFYVNFAVFSVFLTLFITEMMGAVLLLLFYEKSRKSVLDYIVPIWEVTGTFAAFWVVTADFAYPSLLLPVASLFAATIIIFLILFVARNASISFAELIIRRGWLDEKKLYKMYSLFTLPIGLVVITVLSTIVSGRGISLSNYSFSLAAWISDPASILYVAGVLFTGIGLAPVFYSMEEFRRLTVPLTSAGILLSAISLYLYSPSFITPMFLVPVLLTLVPPLLYQSRVTAPLVSNKLVFGTVTAFIIFSLNYIVYPTAFGGRLVVDEITAKGPMAEAFLLLSAAGAVIIGLLMILYIVAARNARKGRVSTEHPA